MRSGAVAEGGYDVKGSRRRSGERKQPWLRRNLESLKKGVLGVVNFAGAWVRWVEFHKDLGAKKGPGNNGGGTGQRIKERSR